MSKSVFVVVDLEDEGQGPNMSEYELITYLTEMVSLSVVVY